MSAGPPSDVSPRLRPVPDRLTASTLEARLRERLRCLELRITDDSHLHAGHAGAQGGAAHFTVQLLSADFEGLKRLARHRLIYDAVSDWIPDRIHALVIDARAPSELATAASPLAPSHSSPTKDR